MILKTVYPSYGEELRAKRLILKTLYPKKRIIKTASKATDLIRQTGEADNYYYNLASHYYHLSIEITKEEAERITSFLDRGRYHIAIEQCNAQDIDGLSDRDLFGSSIKMTFELC